MTQHQPIKQHLIDPEICIRCHTCEEACSIGAITHNEDNVVVDASICNFCMDCIAPCPTGSIDNWRIVTEAYSVDEQLEWMELPEQGEVDAGDGDEDDVVARLLEEAHAGAGGAAFAPASAATPAVNLFTKDAPATAKVQGNYRLTDADAESDTRHIILDLGANAFPVLEGQTVGVIPPGTDDAGQAHALRLYSVSSPRDGEREATNNLSLTVKRDEGGIASNYLCDLAKGDEVTLVGPFGNSFLIPDDPDTRLLMICTGTGSAPFRAFTMRRQREGIKGGSMTMFFGARSKGELPYFGPLGKIPTDILTSHLVFSREGEQEYVQDRMRRNAAQIIEILSDPKGYVYICGLKAMETGVEDALRECAAQAGLDWESLRATLRQEGRYHVETY